MNVSAKLKGTVIALAAYYCALIFVDYSLFCNWRIWIPILFCTAVYLVQPAASMGQTKSVEDKNSMLVLFLATLISQNWVVLEWAYLHPYFEVDLYTILGIVLMLAGFVIRWWAIRELRDFFTNVVQIQPGHQLIKTGPYALVRHPSYTGAFMVAVGIGVYLHAWTGVMVTIPVLLAAYSYRIEIEESRLLSVFGVCYEKYRQRTQKMVWLIW